MSCRVVCAVQLLEVMVDPRYVVVDLMPVIYVVIRGSAFEAKFLENYDSVQ